MTTAKKISDEISKVEVVINDEDVIVYAQYVSVEDVWLKASDSISYCKQYNGNENPSNKIFNAPLDAITRKIIGSYYTKNNLPDTNKIPDNFSELRGLLIQKIKTN